MVRVRVRVRVTSGLGSGSGLPQVVHRDGGRLGGAVGLARYDAHEARRQRLLRVRVRVRI